MPGWISVDERLPEKGKVVITCIIGTDIEISNPAPYDYKATVPVRVSLGYIEDFYKNGDVRYPKWNDYESMPEIVSPSYWMEIPEPPALELPSRAEYDKELIEEAETIVDAREVTDNG